MTYLSPPAKTVITSPSRPGDLRYSDLIRPLKENSFRDLRPGDCVLVGCPDDRGVRANRGRPGAKLGPNAIRAHLYASTVFAASLPFTIYDAGNFRMGKSLSVDQRKVSEIIEKIIDRGALAILLGGGHDWAYSDLSALCRFSQKTAASPLLINLDAHADYRPYTRGPHNGSPFRQLLDEFGNTTYPPLLYALGLQYACNSVEHLSQAKAAGIQLTFLEDLLFERKTVSEQVQRLLQIHALSPFALSVDMDGIEGMQGVSASSPTGISIGDVLRCVSIAGQARTVRCFGIFETNPKTDITHHTAKLASRLLCEFFRSRIRAPS